MKFYVDPTFTCMLHTKKDFDWISNTLYRRAIIHVIEIGLEHKKYTFLFFFCHENFKISKCWKVPQESEELMAKMQQCDCEETVLKLALAHFASSSERQIAIGHIGTNTTCAKCTRMRQNRPVLKRKTQPSRASFVYMTC